MTRLQSGCGNGRDSFFFAQQGLHVVGVDASQVAIRNNQEQADTSSFEAPCVFVLAQLGPGASWEQLTVQRTVKPTAIYCRFVLHAVTQAEAKAILDFCAAFLKPQEKLYLEFRTTRDPMLQRGEKVGEHEHMTDHAGGSSNPNRSGIKWRSGVGKNCISSNPMVCRPIKTTTPCWPVDLRENRCPMMSFFKHMAGLLSFVQTPRAQRRVVFYSEGPTYWVHLQGLVQALLASGEVPVCYVSSNPADPGLALQHANTKLLIDQLGAQLVFENLQADVLVMTMPDLDQYQVKRSNTSCIMYMCNIPW